MTEQLKPCPFCDGAAHFFKITDLDDKNFGGEGICCGSCPITTDLMFSLMEDCKPKLAEAWNRRAQPAQPCHPAEDGVCERLDCENHQPAQAVPLLSDDIIRMAREAGIDALTKVGADELERFAVLVSKHDFADAYRGAMDELYIWKRRALDAEASSRQLKEKFGAYDHLKMHAVEELCQLGYTVKDGELLPPDHLHKLMEAAQHPLASTHQAMREFDKAWRQNLKGGQHD